MKRPGGKGVQRANEKTDHQMKKWILLTVLAAASAFVAPDIQAQVVVKVRPVRPAKVVVTKPARPSARYVWVDGHWRWNNRSNRYVWVDGRWIKRKRGRVWVAGRWKKVPGGFIWVEGYWRRA